MLLDKYTRGFIREKFLNILGDFFTRKFDSFIYSIFSREHTVAFRNPQIMDLSTACLLNLFAESINTAYDNRTSLEIIWH